MPTNNALGHNADVRILPADTIIDETIAALIDDLNRSPANASPYVLEAQLRPTVEVSVREAVRLGCELAAVDISRQLEERGIDLGFTVETSG